MNTYECTENVNTQLLQDWRQDFLLQRRIPLGHAWRGCAGLAAFLVGPDLGNFALEATETFYPNDAIAWLRLSDVPPGYFPGAGMNNRMIRYASRCTAKLKFGMPMIDFAEPTRLQWDLSLEPRAVRVANFDEADFDKRVCGAIDLTQSSNELAILTAVSRQMTRLAHYGVDGHGIPLRPAWAWRRPRGGMPYRVTSVARWMPRAYLGFPSEYARQLVEPLVNRLLRARERWGNYESSVSCCPAEGLRLSNHPGKAFYPAGWIAATRRQLNPTELVWNFGPAVKYVNPALKAAIFPPVPLRCWDQFHLSLPGDVIIDLGIGDPRFKRLPARDHSPSSRRNHAQPLIACLPAV